MCWFSETGLTENVAFKLFIYLRNKARVIVFMVLWKKLWYYTDNYGTIIY